MFADPQTMTVDAVPKTFNRLTTQNNGSTFGTSDRLRRLVISHQDGKRLRHSIRSSKDVTVANPLIAGNNIVQSMSVYLVVDVPNGYDTADAKKEVDGFIGLLQASTGAAVVKLLGGES